MDGLSVEAGPQIGILVSAKDTYGGSDDSGELNIKDFYNTLDTGFGLGAAYRLNNGIFFNAHYVLGITDIIKDFDSDFGESDFEKFKHRNNVIQLSAGYSF